MINTTVLSLMHKVDCVYSSHARAWVARAALVCGLLVAPTVAAAQVAPTLSLPQQDPANALVGTSGPQFGGDRGVGQFSGFAYERQLLPRLLARLSFGQAYGDGSPSRRDFVTGGIPVRETTFTDFSRLSVGAQIGLIQPMSRGARALLFGGPTWSRISERENLLLTDLRFGDTVQRSRETFSGNFGGMLYAFGMEFDLADNFAWRATVLHNRASGDSATTVAVGGAIKF